MASYPVSKFSLIDLISDVQWRPLLEVEFKNAQLNMHVKNIESLLTQHYTNRDPICPEKHLIFNALNMTPLKKIRAVIVGQDPYTGGQATGLAFSVPFYATIPPSLGNIFKLFKMIIPGFEIPNHGCLDLWASNGILLLNSILTVTAGTSTSMSMSHSKYGWQELTNAIIRIISEQCHGVVFILFGSVAHKKEGFIDISKHFVYKFPHPSPLSMSSFLQDQDQLVPYPIGAPISQVNWTLYNV